MPQALIDRTYEAAARFHARPMAKKLALKVNEHDIGYLPISNAASPQAAAQGRKPNQNEAYFLRRERTPGEPAAIASRRFHCLNRWPDDLPGFRATTLEYIRTLEALCRRLVPLYALALVLPADFFDACVIATRPGLSILLPNGRWIGAPRVDGAYGVNGGDILHRWPNERFLSTPPRVRNVSSQVRYAILFFCDPDHETVIE